MEARSRFTLTKTLLQTYNTLENTSDSNNDTHTNMNQLQYCITQP